MKHPWRFLLAALAGTTLVAVGFALAVDGVLAGGQPAPQLRSVPPATLARAGLTLRPATQPPYCGVAQQAAHNGWVQAGFGGCAISRDAAEQAVALPAGPAAGPAGSSQVVESLLARVTISNRQPALHDRLAWLVVLHGGPVMMPAILCGRAGMAGAATTGPAAPCPPSMPAPTLLLRVVVVDGTTGQFLASLSPGVVQHRPGTGAAPFAPQPTAPAVRASPMLVPPQGA